MSEFFDWINIERKEFLSPVDFDWGANYHHSLQISNPLLPALYELLATDWKGCRIIHFGEESRISPDMAAKLFPSVNELSTHDIFADGIIDVFGTFKNISCQFAAAERYGRQNIQIFISSIGRHFMERNAYQIDPVAPYKGLFKRKGKTFNYIANHTKRVFYSLETTQMYMTDGTKYIDRTEDPLGYFVGYGASCPPGLWLGDIIGVSDEAPEGYAFLDKIYFDWI